MSDRLQGSMIALHGPPKVGKTQLAAHFPGPVQFLATEVGHKFIPEDQQKALIRLPPEVGWDVFRSYVRGDTGKGFKKPKTVVIDTISGLYQLCFDCVCKENNWSHAGDGAHGKGWAVIRREFVDALARLTHMCDEWNATLLVLDHTKTETIEVATSTYEKVTFAMTGQARDVVLRIPDHMWFLGYAEEDPKDALIHKSGKRALFIGGNSRIEAGTRDSQVKVKIIMPLSQKDPYSQIIKELYKS